MLVVISWQDIFLVGYNERYLVISLSIRLSIAFSLSHIFIKNVTKIKM